MPKMAAPTNIAIGRSRSCVWYMSVMTPPIKVENTELATPAQKRAAIIL
jgi:hypothetical protein